MADQRSRIHSALQSTNLFASLAFSAFLSGERSSGKGGCVFTNSPHLFSIIHDYPVLFALAVAGGISVAVFVVWVLLRAFGDIYEEWCNLRRRCAESRRRLKQETRSG